MGAVGETVRIARLILLNGPPAAGKSTLARRYVDDHAGAALVEVDAFRTSLPNWDEDERTRLVARELATGAVAEHLRAGVDVVMPQYFGRVDPIVRLDDLARDHDAAFVEVIVETSVTTAIERFRARRRAMAERGERHPERDVVDVEAAVVDAIERLARLPDARPRSRVITAESGASVDDLYRRLLAVLAE